VISPTRYAYRPTPLLLLLLVILGCAGLRTGQAPDDAIPAQEAFQPIRRLAFLGEATLEYGLEFEQTTIGGLSALTFDSKTGSFYSLPDDPSKYDPTRIYGLSIDLGDGQLDPGDVVVDSVLLLRDKNGDIFPTHAIDGEGLALSSGGGFFISSEGNVKRGIQPSLHELDASGNTIRTLALPQRYESDPREAHGVRHNLAFEALTLTPSGRWLYTGIENALVQDGPEADLDRPSPSRILQFDARTGEPVAEYLYSVGPVPEPPAEADGFRVNGLVELLALDDQHLLALERAFSAGAGNTVRLYRLDLTQATDISDLNLSTNSSTIQPAAKTLLVDLADLGIEIDNIEGLTFGPTLSDGRETLLLISDNNFSAAQKTQILAFAWSNQPVTVSEIQGAGHLSRLDGQWLFDIRGVVTAVDDNPRQPKAWIQTLEADDDLATSEGILLQFAASVDLSPGDIVTADGRLTEAGRPGNLSVTCLCDASPTVLSTGGSLPLPVLLDGARIPGQIDNDGLAEFEPADDAIDFLESLEGMRVEVPPSVIVGASSRFGDLVVIPAGAGQNALESTPRTSAGGVRLTATGSSTQRIQVDPRLLASVDRDRLAQAHVGDALGDSLIGVLDYAFGAFEIVLTEAPGKIASGSAGTDSQGERLAPGESTTLSPSGDNLTIATFNVENLDALDSEAKFAAVAAIIVDGLGGPDILGLQEIQDDNGAADDGVVSAVATLGRLVEEVAAAGGPRYEFHQVDPENNADGGQPGANIRVAYLVNPARVSVPLHGTADARTSATVETLEDGAHLSHNPGRIAADDRAFAFDQELGFRASRKALALEVEFNSHRLFIVNAHLKSKGGDNSPFGSIQPPRRITEKQRLEQARSIRAFAEEIQAADPTAAIVILGDLNEHEFRPPVLELTEGDLVNLIERVPLSERYTYNFRGNSQVIDHVLVSSALAEIADPVIDIVHVNADFPAGQRASDHDPIVVRLDLSGF
jgi:predicted extracellular nuclease